MSFETALSQAQVAGYETPLLAIALGRGNLPQSLDALDKGTGGALARLLSSGDFAGKKDEVAVVYPTGPAARVLLVGLGKADEIDRATIRRAAAIAAKRARSIGVPRAAFHLPAEARGKVAPEEAGQAIAEGLAQGAWQYNEMKRRDEESKKPELERVDILLDRILPNSTPRRAAAGSGHRGRADLCPRHSGPAGQHLHADLSGERGAGAGAAPRVRRSPCSTRPPSSGRRWVRCMAVAQGSAEEPRFIALEYKGAEGPPMVLIGKGVTFDTGGISIKPAQNMEDMKYDMSGAAAVLGTFEALGRLKPKVHVVGLIPSTENMPSGTAVKPGDVVTSHLGQDHRDDQHRRRRPADSVRRALLRPALPAGAVIDIATLTGAIVVALGHTATGVMGSDEQLVEEVRAAGEHAGERVWPLPLWEDYRELMKSDIADVKNSGGRPAGSISAGWFLREFVDGFPWAHLDIAGTAYTDRDEPARVKGPTGMGVRLFTEFVLGRRAIGEKA